MSGSGKGERSYSVEIKGQAVQLTPSEARFLLTMLGEIEAGSVVIAEIERIAREDDADQAGSKHTEPYSEPLTLERQRHLLNKLA